MSNDRVEEITKEIVEYFMKETFMAGNFSSNFRAEEMISQIVKYTLNYRKPEGELIEALEAMLKYFSFLPEGCKCGGCKAIIKAQKALGRRKAG